MKKTITLLIVLLSLATVAFAKEDSFKLNVDAMINPFAPPKAGVGDVVNIIPSSLFAGYGGRMGFTWNERYPMLQGDGTNPLTAGNNLVWSSSVELSPVTFAIRESLTFTPIAFIVLSAGFEDGIGWPLAKFKGLATWNPVSKKYDDVLDCYESFWIDAMFQFDLAAVLPGEWNHVVTQWKYQLNYADVLGLSGEHPYLWQNGGEKLAGLGYYISGIVGYQMPLVLQTAGVLFEWSGNYTTPRLSALYEDWNPKFCTINISPVFVLKFNEQHSLSIQCQFTGRHRFAEQIEEYGSNFDLKTTGREWYFKQIGMSYSYLF